MAYVPYFPAPPFLAGGPVREYYYSAYGIAVKNGFQGTEEEWLASLVGPAGPQGTGLVFLGQYDTLEDLQSAHPTGEAGDVYRVGTAEPYSMEWESGITVTSTGDTLITTW